MKSITDTLTDIVTVKNAYRCADRTHNFDPDGRT
jgi:hypothetical protein